MVPVVAGRRRGPSGRAGTAVERGNLHFIHYFAANNAAG
jgi:hypothetical protein